MVLVVDAANVVGARPDGWWRDRAGASARLVDRLSRALESGTLAAPVLVVLEGAARAGVPEGEPRAGLRVAHAPRDGDSAIAASVRELVAAGSPVTLVTADRALRTDATTSGASVLGPSWLLDRLP